MRVTGDQPGTRVPRVVVVNAALAACVWLVWALVWGPRFLDALQANWPVALTMVFGSLIGGGTSEGGGAVSFPVMTKLLSVPADEARVFTFAIQSVGMTAASISILACRVPVERRVVVHGSAAGVVGVVVSAVYLAPLVPLPLVRVLFTMLLVALAVALLLQLFQRGYRRNPAVPEWTVRERALVVGAGFAGGVLSGVAGVGENCVMFLLLVLLFRVSEKVSTPTTVIMMTVVSIGAFTAHVFVIGDFTGAVVGYWVAAAPVVAVGAPLGAWICTRLTPFTIRMILFALIASELVSTLLFVPFTPLLTVLGLTTLTVLTVLCVAFIRSDRYAAGGRPPGEDDQARAPLRSGAG
ncbi:permease [Nocardiopsis sp. CNR-923]|uniref:TSUP family transporter n=1 Tax=Nocardiopsis sp. CNR-923 TaxID=1904965 RepID=UPI0009642A71|nr:TSUP family transporter [Nocardiopsis sp. CNR-923]OLT29384.1 permease [Nocardiopsis sp. CNR-923]